MPSSEVATTTPLLSDAQLADAKSFDDAIAMLAQAGIEVQSLSDFGDGYAVMEKKEIVNAPFVIMEAKIVPAAKSDHGTSFVVLRIMTKDGRKAIITDGSTTGICKQIVSLTERGVQLVGKYAEKGLVASEYDYTNPETGKTAPATTHYIYGL